MKIVRLIIKIFNCVIMAIAALATVFLFASPSLSFNSRVDVNVEKFSQFIPETDYTKDIDVPYLLGTDTISVGLKFKVYPKDVSKTMKGDKDEINNLFINDNVNDIVSELHEPVELITDFTIHGVMKKTIGDQIYKYVDEARQKYENEHPTHPKHQTQDLMDSANLNDEYFTTFTNAMYDTANADDATLDDVNETLYVQIEEALNKVKKSGVGKIDSTAFNESKKAEISESLAKILGQLNLIKEDGVHLQKISQIAYAYLSKFICDELTKKGVDSETLKQRSGEQLRDYSDRLLGEFVRQNMPDLLYQIVGGVSIGLFIGLFIFTITWLFLIVFTAYRTFLSKKKGPWTFFGPWFWIAGVLQLVLGIVLTAAGKVVLPQKFDIATLGLPVTKLLVAPRTYALVPSILVIVCFGLAIAYTVLKILFKKKLKAENSAEGSAK